MRKIPQKARTKRTRIRKLTRSLKSLTRGREIRVRKPRLALPQNGQVSCRVWLTARKNDHTVCITMGSLSMRLVKMIPTVTQGKSSMTSTTPTFPIKVVKWKSWKDLELTRLKQQIRSKMITFLSSSEHQINMRKSCNSRLKRRFHRR